MLECCLKSTRVKLRIQARGSEFWETVQEGKAVHVQIFCAPIDIEVYLRLWNGESRKIASSRLLSVVSSSRRECIQILHLWRQIAIDNVDAPLNDGTSLDAAL